MVGDAGTKPSLSYAQVASSSVFGRACRGWEAGERALHEATGEGGRQTTPVTDERRVRQVFPDFSFYGGVSTPSGVPLLL